MKFIVVDGSAYVTFNVMNFTKIKAKAMFDGNIHWFIVTTS
jgi:hypothetical protein